jgi:hypothetical protein
VEAVEAVEPTSYGGAPVDFDARTIEDWDEAEEKAGDDESEDATEAPSMAGMYKGGGPGGGGGSSGHDSIASNPPPMYAQADDDDDDAATGDDDSALPDRKDEVNVDVVTSKIKDAKTANDHVKIQQQVIDEGIEDANDLNDELAKILEELRREQGLEDEEPYVSPKQQAIEPIIERGTEQMQQQVVQQMQQQVQAQDEYEAAEPPQEEAIDDEDDQAAAAAATEDDP